MSRSLFLKLSLTALVLAAGGASVAPHVRYYDEQGKFSDEYDLVIEKAGAFYNASWITNGKVSAGLRTRKAAHQR